METNHGLGRSICIGRNFSLRDFIYGQQPTLLRADRWLPSLPCLAISPPPLLCIPVVGLYPDGDDDGDVIEACGVMALTTTMMMMMAMMMMMVMVVDLEVVLNMVW